MFVVIFKAGFVVLGFLRDGVIYFCEFIISSGKENNGDLVALSKVEVEEARKSFEKEYRDLLDETPRLESELGKENNKIDN